MNAKYWVQKALDRCRKDREHMGDILVKAFQDAIDHTVEEAEAAYAEVCAERDKLKAIVEARLNGTNL